MACIEKIYHLPTLVDNDSCNANCNFCAGKYLRPQAKENSKIIYFGGVPGVGKTTLGKLITDYIPSINYISSGEIKGIEAKRRFNQNLSSLNQEQTYILNSWFFDKLKSEKQKGVYLVDTHYTYPLPDKKFVKLLHDKSVKIIDLFILVEAEANEIAQRRINRGRKKDSVNINFIKEEIKNEREEAYHLSEVFNKPLIKLNNNDTLETSINSLYFNLKDYIKKW